LCSNNSEENSSLKRGPFPKIGKKQSPKKRGGKKNKLKNLGYFSILLTQAVYYQQLKFIFAVPCFLFYLQQKE